MWKGFERSVHFLDKFTFMSEKLFASQGGMTSYFPFHTNTEFCLTVHYKTIGKMTTNYDGFVTVLSESAINLKPKTEQETLYPLTFDEKLNEVYSLAHFKWIFLLSNWN